MQIAEAADVRAVLRESVVVVKHYHIGAASGETSNVCGDVILEAFVLGTICAVEILAFYVYKSLVFGLGTVVVAVKQS